MYVYVAMSKCKRPTSILGQLRMQAAHKLHANSRLTESADYKFHSIFCLILYGVTNWLVYKDF